MISKADTELTSEQIQDEIRRAKLRALRLLEAMDRTEANLREKLQSAGFGSQAVETAIAYVKSYGYLDDERYVRVYIESKSRTKSRRQIEMELIYKKGIDKALVDKGFETAETADPVDVIEKYLKKRKIDPYDCDYEQKQKFYAYMLRKGFQLEDLKKVFDLT
ncbi:MAG: regulatory protein RecX [Lachnospiraceae bacterium]